MFNILYLTNAEQIVDIDFKSSDFVPSTSGVLSADFGNCR